MTSRRVIQKSIGICVLLGENAAALNLIFVHVGEANLVTLGILPDILGISILQVGNIHGLLIEGGFGHFVVIKLLLFILSLRI